MSEKVNSAEIEKIVKDVMRIILHENCCGETCIPNKVYVEVFNEPRRDQEGEEDTECIITNKPVLQIEVQPKQTRADAFKILTKENVADHLIVGLVKNNKPEVYNNPFSPQDNNLPRRRTAEDLDVLFTKNNGYPNYGLIGTWKIDDAKKIAKQLHDDGFRIWIRGRGKRTVGNARNSFVYQQCLPLKLASHGSIYIDLEKLTRFTTTKGA